MSTELKGVKALGGNVNLTSYFGGEDNGVCIQVGPDYGQSPYLQLNKKQARELAVALFQFADGTREEVD